MEKRIAVVELEIPARDVDGLNIFRALEAAVELSREQPRLTTLSGVKVRRVRFPEPDVPTAAGEGQEIRYQELTGDALVRAEAWLRDYWHPLQVDGTESLKIYWAGTLVGFATVEGVRLPVRDRVFPDEIRHILHG